MAMRVIVYYETEMGTKPNRMFCFLPLILLGKRGSSFILTEGVD